MTSYIPLPPHVRENKCGQLTTNCEWQLLEANSVQMTKITELEVDYRWHGQASCEGIRDQRDCASFEVGVGVEMRVMYRAHYKVLGW